MHVPEFAPLHATVGQPQLPRRCRPALPVELDGRR